MISSFLVNTLFKDGAGAIYWWLKTASACFLSQVTRLRGHLEQIKHDDRMIKAEGLDSLSEEELRQVWGRV